MAIVQKKVGKTHSWYYYTFESNGEDHIDKRKMKKDVSKLLKLALDVEITDEKIIGDVEKVYTDL